MKNLIYGYLPLEELRILKKKMKVVFAKVKQGYRVAFKEPYFPLPDRVYRFNEFDDIELKEEYDKHIKMAYQFLTFNNDLFEKNVVSVVDWFARYALKTPASEHYHHIDPGSYLFHSIQTANLAAKYASTSPTLLSTFDIDQKEEYRMAIPYAAWIAGLIHDIGKSVTDFVVIALDVNLKRRSEVKNWDPNEQSLYDWCKSNQCKYYRVIYNPNRKYNEHMSVVPLFIPKVLDVIPSSYASKPLLTKILSEIFNNNKDSTLKDIITQADSKSCEIDVNHFSRVPVANDDVRIFINSLQDYDAYYEGIEGESDFYFYSPIGLHIEYPMGVKRIINYLVRFYGMDENRKTLRADVAFWVDNLSKFGTLVPNYDSVKLDSSEENKSSPYIYDVIVNEFGAEVCKKVITLQNAHLIRLSKIADKKDVTLASQRKLQTIKPNPPLPKNKLNSTSESENNKTIQPEEQPDCSDSMNTENTIPDALEQSLEVPVEPSVEANVPGETTATEDMLDVQNLSAPVSTIEDTPLSLSLVETAADIDAGIAKSLENTSVNSDDTGSNPNIDEASSEGAELGEGAQTNGLVKEHSNSIAVLEEKIISEYPHDHKVVVWLRKTSVNYKPPLRLFIIWWYEVIDQSPFSLLWEEDHILMLGVNGLLIRKGTIPVLLTSHRESFSVSQSEWSELETFWNQFFEGCDVPEIFETDEKKKCTQYGFVRIREDIAKIILTPKKDEIEKLIKQGKIKL